MHFFKKFFDAANQSIEAVSRQIIRTTQRNLEAGLDLAKSLASARDPFEIAKLQASFWWKQLNEFSAQAELVHKRLFGFGMQAGQAIEISSGLNKAGFGAESNLGGENVFLDLNRSQRSRGALLPEERVTRQNGERRYQHHDQDAGNRGKQSGYGVGAFHGYPGRKEKFGPDLARKN